MPWVGGGSMRQSLWGASYDVVSAVVRVCTCVRAPCLRGRATAGRRRARAHGSVQLSGAGMQGTLRPHST